MYEFRIMTPPNMSGRQKALHYAKLFHGQVYEDPRGNGYVVCFEVESEESCKSIGRYIDRRELLPNLPC